MGDAYNDTVTPAEWLGIDEMDLMGHQEFGIDVLDHFARGITGGFRDRYNQDEIDRMEHDIRENYGLNSLRSWDLDEDIRLVQEAARTYVERFGGISGEYLYRMKEIVTELGVPEKQTVAANFGTEYEADGF
ncbi:MAG: hypothetical protein SVY41_01440 [Candidatus Nanohaloarchaea archaeon]|nr:hypothetical protein [Candidatus Nanohaloarchaea archaeon]